MEKIKKALQPLVNLLAVESATMTVEEQQGAFDALETIRAILKVNNARKVINDLNKSLIKTIK